MPPLSRARRRRDEDAADDDVSESPACGALALSASSRPLRAAMERGGEKCEMLLSSRLSLSSSNNQKTKGKKTLTTASLPGVHALSRHEDNDDDANHLPATLNAFNSSGDELDRSNNEEPGAAATAPIEAAAATGVQVLVGDIDICAHSYRSHLPLLRRPRCVMDRNLCIVS